MHMGCNCLELITVYSNCFSRRNCIDSNCSVATKMKDKGWRFKAVGGFEEEQTNIRMDIGDYKVAFATGKDHKSNF